MAQLKLINETQPGQAANGNSSSAYIVMTVFDQGGRPVDGLTASDFVFRMGFGLTAVDITFVSSSIVTNGTYQLTITPSVGITWISWTHIWVVRVTSGSDRGQTLAKIVIP